MPNMAAASKIPWRYLERRSATAFLVAGLLWVGDTSLLGLEHLQIYTHGLWNGVLISGAMLATVIGLLGFVPKFYNERPTLAIVNALIGGLAVITMVATVVWSFGAVLVANISTPPGITALPTLVAFTWFGIASIWSDIPSRSVGFLLWGLAAPWIGILVLIFLGAPAWVASPPSWGIAVIVAGFAVLSIAIGYIIRTSQQVLDPSEQTTDTPNIGHQ